MFTVLQDLRFALRQLRKSIGFTMMATLTLALGIGAATAVFSLVDAVLLKPLPFPQPERIVVVQTLTRPRSSDGPATVPNDTSYPNFFDWRDHARSFESIASYQSSSFTLGATNTAAQRVDGMTVSSDFFRVLGVTPALGRSFQRSEEQAGDLSVILSHSLWQSAMGANPGAIGKTIQLNDESYTVVGVMPAGFEFPNAPDTKAWTTSAIAMDGKNPSGKQRGWNQLEVIGRLAAGVSIKQARAEMQTIQNSLAAQYPDDNKMNTGASVVPELQDLVGDVQRPIGLAASAALTQFIATLLFATKALDVATFAGMALLLLVISTVSSLVPAYRASRLDPIESLRQQ